MTNILQFIVFPIISLVLGIILHRKLRFFYIFGITFVGYYLVGYFLYSSNFLLNVVIYSFISILPSIIRFIKTSDTPIEDGKTLEVKEDNE